MSIVTFSFVPMLPKLAGGIAIPTTLPVAKADAEVDTPLWCRRKPGNVTSHVPLVCSVNRPFAAQSAVITPGDPPNVKKLGLPLVLVPRCSVTSSVSGPPYGRARPRSRPSSGTQEVWSYPLGRAPEGCGELWHVCHTDLRRSDITYSDLCCGRAMGTLVPGMLQAPP